MATNLDGRAIAARLCTQIQTTVSGKSLAPNLALVLATNDEAATSYIRIIRKMAERTGIKTELIDLGVDASQQQLRTKLDELAADATVHGIILQTPLPDDVNGDELRAHIPLDKDVDGASPLSSGRLITGQKCFVPATAEAVMVVLHEYNIPIAGSQAVIVGRSRVVGKPLSLLLLQEDATVTICHTKTKDLKAVTSRGDILVAAAGQAELITPEFVKPGANVIDVGTNLSADGKLVGDVQAEQVSKVAGTLSPVPGGVGPVTTAILLQHTLQAATNVK